MKGYEDLIFRVEKLKKADEDEVLGAYKTIKTFLEKVEMLAIEHNLKHIQYKASGLKFTIVHELKEIFTELSKYRREFFEDEG